MGGGSTIVKTSCWGRMGVVGGRWKGIGFYMFRLMGFPNRTILGVFWLASRAWQCSREGEKEDKHEGFSPTTPKINITKGSVHFVIIKMLERKVQHCRFALTRIVLLLLGDCKSGSIARSLGWLSGLQDLRVTFICVDHCLMKREQN